ncbi:MAG: 3-hydroxyacyl-CoA dehydrogenase family protein [Desulfarculaceae bacterium]|nr:3-hydroxyacyl-CoA dehydrogenase family protein [Desulfarculaceae bacterium]MCF8070884.1 3-hydroxyacyl-CoA dehydrogenase family protein [Desulfarculaceae bacterium]MCF8100472.1 3-hydroxyacyl-CoA dehydrogenase family protein [Desulfarculaceae bacterium]MCF8118213.1 3-hydroxyacyl-CoA dehydrogenase family protein [Desulfarculaceae bacterium]
MSEIKTIGVVGAGTMGNGIAQLAAQTGASVIMRDIKDEFVERGLGAIDKFLSKGVERGKVTPEAKAEVLGRIKGTTDMGELAAADFIIEAVIEDLDLKKSVYGELDEVCRPEVILATNTSSMSITLIAAATKRPDQVVGMHFFNPAQIMRLCEIIRGQATNDQTVAVTTELAQKMGKETVEVMVDSPGFIVNRLMIPHMVEAARMLQEGVASKEDIDKAVKLGLNYPMGPFELMDFTGVDICKFVADYFAQELNKELKWEVPTNMKNQIRAGRLGRKSGAGWYDYNK